jgi:hypothetical protein
MNPKIQKTSKKKLIAIRGITKFINLKLREVEILYLVLNIFEIKRFNNYRII